MSRSGHNAYDAIDVSRLKKKLSEITAEFGIHKNLL